MNTFLLNLLGAALLLPSIAFATVPETPQQRGTMVAGVALSCPPMVYRDPLTGRLTGFDIELGEALARHLGITIEWRETTPDQMLDELAGRRYDMTLSALTDAPRRQASAIFVDYLNSGPQFYILTNTIGIDSYLDVCGKTVGTSRQANWHQELMTWSDTYCRAAGLPAVQVVTTEGTADARSQLHAGRIAIALQNSETLRYHSTREPRTYRPVGLPMTRQLNGIAVNHADSELARTLAQALQNLMNDGTYAALLSKWGLQQAAVPRASINDGR